MERPNYDQLRKMDDPPDLVWRSIPTEPNITKENEICIANTRKFGFVQLFLNLNGTLAICNLYIVLDMISFTSPRYLT